MNFPLSDLQEIVIKKEVRSNPNRDWKTTINDIILGKNEAWNQREDIAPHSVGWLYQYVVESRRKSAFRKHVKDEEKHINSSFTTQIFTPRWLADRICQRAILSKNQHIYDPAVGSGQFLLAAFDRLIELGATPQDAAQQISGSDLDEEVLRIANYILSRRFEKCGVKGYKPQLKCGDLLEIEWHCEVTLTNPPFMGRRSMNDHIRKKVDYFRPFHFDLFAATIFRAFESSPTIGIVAPQSFWFLESFREAREFLIKYAQLDEFYLLGKKTFLSLSGMKSLSAAFILKKPNKNKTTHFYDLRNLAPIEKAQKLETSKSIKCEASKLMELPGSPLVFFMEAPLRKAFRNMIPLSQIAEIIGGGNKTANNKKYLRRLHTLDPTKVLNVQGLPTSGKEGSKWVVYSKGGRFAPWWGNWDYAIDWSEEAQAFYQKNRSSNLLNPKYHFRRGLCYSDLGSVSFSVRQLPKNTLFDMTGPAIFVENDDVRKLNGLMVLLNSTAVRKIIAALNPTIHVQVREVRRIPIPIESLDLFAEIGKELTELVQKITQGDWGEYDRFLQLEQEADALVCSKYGIKTLTLEERPVHHELFKKFHDR